MNKTVNTSIYIIYVIIALVSVSISYKVSLSLTLIVIALEYVRLLALYKKVYSVILLVFALNLTLLTYNSYKQQQITALNNSNITTQNELTTNYLNNTRLKASTFKELNNNIKELKQVELEYWFISLVYILLELSLIALIFNINKQEQKVQKQLKKQNTKKTSKTKKQEIEPKKEQLNGKKEEKLKYIGSYREYAENNNINREEAKELFKTWKDQSLIKRVDNKNYLKKKA